MNKILHFSISAFLFLGFGLHCSNPQKELDDAVASYSKTDDSGNIKIEKCFLKLICIKNYASGNLYNNDNFVFYHSSYNADLVYPVEKKLPTGERNNIFVYNPSDDLYAISNGIELFIKDEKRNLTKDVTIGTEKSKILGMALYNDLVIYYKDGKLYYYDVASDKNDVFMNASFPSPYGKFFTAGMTIKGNILILNVGVAGTYSCNIIDMSSKTVLIRDIGLSSSKYSFDDKNIYYIGGSIGSWELINMTVKEKRKTTLSRFSDITDIELFPSGFAFEDGKGIWISDYKGKRARLPFKLQFAGKTGDLILLKSGNKTYLADFKFFQEQIFRMKEKVPEIFASK